MKIKIESTREHKVGRYINTFEFTYHNVSSVDEAIEFISSHFDTNASKILDLLEMKSSCFKPSTVGRKLFPEKYYFIEFLSDDQFKVN